MKHDNRCELPNFSIGKVILCRHNGGFVLYGKPRLFPELERRDAEEAKKIFKEIAGNPERSARLFGFHENIGHEGTITGGAFLMVHHGRIYLAGQSAVFGPVDPEDIRQCVIGHEVEEVRLQ